MPRFETTKRRYYKMGETGLMFYEGDPVTPTQLRELADLIEKDIAYASAYIEISGEGDKELLGTDNYGREKFRYMDKRIKIDVQVYTSVLVIDDDGKVSLAD